MIDRKKFFKQLFAGLSVGMVSSALPARVEDWVARLDSDGASPASTGDYWEELRKHFFHADFYNYFNSATLGLIPDLVAEAMQLQLGPRLGKGRYWLDPDALPKVAEMFGVGNDEVAITQNTTHGINIVAQGLNLRRRDEVILCSHEHVGNALPWLNRARRDGIVIRVMEPALTAAENLDRIASLINRRTRVIALPHITCTTGTIFPLQEMGKLAREKDVYFFVDGAHGPGMIPLNMREFDCDFYASCGHKWLCGPTGSGFLYVRKERLEDIDPLMVGAYSELGWTLTAEEQSIHGFKPEARRFENGTRDPLKHAGIAAAIAFMEEIGWQRVLDRQIELHQQLRKGLEVYEEVEFLTPTEPGSFAGILGFRLPESRMEKFREGVKENHIRIREVKEAGLNSIRISTHVFNQSSNIEILVKVVGQAFS